MLDHRPVLVVEDSDDDFDTVTHAARLARLSNRLVRAIDAADALDAITLHPQGFFAFVLLDYNLPGVDGLAFLYEIRLDCSARQLPVVVLTTSVNPQDRDVFRDAGANAFHVKSVEHTECLRTLESIFERWLNVAAMPGDAVAAPRLEDSP